jgi:hypothetical protein
VGVLEQIGTGFMDEAVGMLVQRRAGLMLLIAHSFLSMSSLCGFRVIGIFRYCTSICEDCVVCLALSRHALGMDGSV